MEQRTHHDEDQNGEVDNCIKKAVLIPPKTDENIVVECFRWPKQRGKAGAARGRDEEEEEATDGELRRGGRGRGSIHEIFSNGATCHELHHANPCGEGNRRDGADGSNRRNNER